MVCDVAADKYSYFTVVNTNLSADGSAADVMFIVMYTVDSTGRFAAFDAYELT